MRRAAREARMSPAALYRYFPSKRDMLLFPLTAECCAEQMRRFEQAHGYLRRRDPRAYVEAFFDEMVATLPFVRAAMRAAVELGAEEFWRVMDEVLDQELEERFLALARAGGLGPGAAGERARAARRAFMGAMLDLEVQPEELRAQLVATIEGTGVIPEEAGASVADPAPRSG